MKCGNDILDQRERERERELGRGHSRSMQGGNAVLVTERPWHYSCFIDNSASCSATRRRDTNEHCWPARLSSTDSVLVERDSRRPASAHSTLREDEEVNITRWDSIVSLYIGKEAL